MAREMSKRNIRNMSEQAQMFRQKTPSTTDRNIGTCGTPLKGGCSDVPPLCRPCMVAEPVAFTSDFTGRVMSAAQHGPDWESTALAGMNDVLVRKLFAQRFLMADRIAEILNTKWPELPLGLDPEERMRRKTVLSAKNGELEAMRECLIEVFAAAFGLRESKKRFSVEVLAANKMHGRVQPPNVWPYQFADDPIYFRRADRRASAVLGQPYAVADDAFRARAGKWANANGLAVSFPDFPSWRYPGQTILVLFEAGR